MTKPLPLFDIIIVYDAQLAHSAADLQYHESAPFAKSGAYFNCNATYQYFIQYCKTQGLVAAFTTTNDISAAGQFMSAWTYSTHWERYQAKVNAKVIFDKFSNLLLRNQAVYQSLTTTLKLIPLLHDQALRLMFDDKLETYRQFPELAIPTVPVTLPTLAGLSEAKKNLNALCQTHPYRADFTTTVVLKDQFGIGGNNIYKITPETDLTALPLNPNTHFILQPFIEASGFTIAHTTGNTDLRVIICNNTIIQSYLRIAQAGEFRANAQQGGEVLYLTLDQIPAEVLAMAATIKERLPNKTALYTLDFIKSNRGHLYFIEGNNSPGLNWFDDADEIRAKQLIHLLVKNLQHLILADES